MDAVDIKTLLALFRTDPTRLHAWMAAQLTYIFTVLQLGRFTTSENVSKPNIKLSL